MLCFHYWNTTEGMLISEDSLKYPVVFLKIHIQYLSFTFSIPVVF
jgi:hypothetical protein